MSSHPDNKNLGPDPNRTFVTAIYKTVVLGGGAWFALFWVTLFVDIIIHNHYSVYTHWAKYMGPAMKWWFIMFFVQSKVKDGGKIWWIATAYLVAVSVPLCGYLLTSVPMVKMSRFLYRQVPFDLFDTLGLGVAEYLFPDVLPVPPPF